MSLKFLPNDILSNIFGRYLYFYELQIADVAYCDSTCRDIFHQQLSIGSKLTKDCFTIFKGLFMSNLFLNSGIISESFLWIKKRNIEVANITYTGRLIKSNVENKFKYNEIEYLSEIDLTKVYALRFGGFKVEDTFNYSSGSDSSASDSEDNSWDIIHPYHTNKFDEREVLFLITNCQSVSDLYFTDPMLTLDLVNCASNRFESLTLLHFRYETVTHVTSICTIISEKCHKLRSLCISSENLFDQEMFLSWNNNSLMDLIASNLYLVDLCVTNVIVDKTFIKFLSLRKFEKLSLKSCSSELDPFDRSLRCSNLIVDTCKLSIELFHQPCYWVIEFNDDENKLHFRYRKYYEYIPPPDINLFLRDIQPRLRVVLFENMVVCTEIIYCLGICHPTLFEIRFIDVRMKMKSNFVLEDDVAAEVACATAVLELCALQCKSLGVFQIVVGGEIDILHQRKHFIGFFEDCLIRREDGRLVEVSMADSSMQYLENEDLTRRVLRVRLSESLLKSSDNQVSAFKKTLFY
jgi:hypothetical protein